MAKSVLPPPPQSTGTQVLLTLQVTNTPTRSVKVEHCENRHGQFVRIVETRGDKTNWACVPQEDLPELAKAITQLI